ncbi:MAG TPA: TRAP transporter small permease [Thermoanaerobacterales bacterium]|nr:TRAP transporter small permease [Thermoanaerobacterales bacterium]
MGIIKKIYQTIEKVQLALGTIFISIFLLTILLQIGSRMMKIPITWSEDVTKYSFVWAVFMGASWAVANDQHFAFTPLRNKLKGRKRIIYNIIICIIVLLFTVSMARYGIEVTRKFWNYKWPNTPQLKMGYIWLSLPVSGITMSFYLIVHILENLINLKKGGNEND